MPRLKTDHVRVSTREGTVAVLFCQHCQEEMPITKPLKLVTMAAVTAAFAKCHAHCLPKEIQRTLW